jgi:hypothetical protein
MYLWFIPKWLQWPRPQLVHWWLLVHSSPKKVAILKTWFGGELELGFD